MNLEFNPSLSKSLSFAASIEGVSRVGLKTRFILEYNNIEYGFYGKVEEGNFKFEIPKLNEVFKSITSTRQSVPVRIEVVSEGSIFSPWKDVASIVVPQVVHATLENKFAKVKVPKINIEMDEKKYSETESKNQKDIKEPKDKSEKFTNKIADFLDRMG